jgi:hypothetical protein
VTNQCSECEKLRMVMRRCIAEADKCGVAVLDGDGAFWVCPQCKCIDANDRGCPVCALLRIADRLEGSLTAVGASVELEQP